MGVGEVVDVGQLQVAVQAHGGIPVLFATSYTGVPMLDPLDASVVAAIDPKLRDRLVSRPMTLDPMLTRPQLEQVCEHEKSRAIGGGITPVCARLAAVSGPTPQIIVAPQRPLALGGASHSPKAKRTPK